MPQGHADAFVAVDIERAVVVRLRREAARRDLPVKALIRDLLAAVAERELTTAILGRE
jgi:hypothetical protein